jgi:hypothetical protein
MPHAFFFQNGQKGAKESQKIRKKSAKNQCSVQRFPHVFRLHSVFVDMVMIGKVDFRIKYFFAALFSLLLYSCGIEGGSTYAESFGVVGKNEDGSLYVKSDEGVTIIPVQDISSIVEPGDRTWISYEIESEEATTNTMKVTPYRVTRILQVSLQNESAISEDGLDLWNVWFAQGFLTFDFRVLATDYNQVKNHDYALIIKKESADTLYTVLKHDAKGDNRKGVVCRTAVTMKVQELSSYKNLIVIAVEYKELGEKGAMRTLYVDFKQ